MFFHIRLNFLVKHSIKSIEKLEDQPFKFQDQTKKVIPIRDALFMSLAAWWLILKKKNLLGQCFAKGRKQIFSRKSLFDKVKKDNF